jgi:hypothetical protein
VNPRDPISELVEVINRLAHRIPHSAISSPSPILPYYFTVEFATEHPLIIAAFIEESTQFIFTHEPGDYGHDDPTSC